MVGANEEAAPVGMAGWNLDWGLDLGLPFKTATPELHRLVIRGWTVDDCGSYRIRQGLACLDHTYSLGVGVTNAPTYLITDSRMEPTVDP